MISTEYFFPRRLASKYGFAKYIVGVLGGGGVNGRCLVGYTYSIIIV